MVYVDDEDELLDKLLEDVLVGAINIDDIMAASAGSQRESGRNIYQRSGR